MTKNKVLTEAFKWLFIGLLICFGVSYAATLAPNEIYGAFSGYGYLIYAILELVFAIILIVRIRKMKPLTAKIIYILYTALSGLSLGGLMLVYTGESICYVFLATALIFGAFAIVGKVTKMDLSKWIVYLSIALLAIIILEVINILLANNTLDMVLCIITILIFCAYVAYDIQVILRSSDEIPNQGIYCAFSLFLDFINLFINLLDLFGKRD